MRWKAGEKGNLLLRPLKGYNYKAHALELHVSPRPQPPTFFYAYDAKIFLP